VSMLLCMILLKNIARLLKYCPMGCRHSHEDPSEPGNLHETTQTEARDVEHVLRERVCVHNLAGESY